MFSAALSLLLSMFLGAILDISTADDDADNTGAKLEPETGDGDLLDFALLPETAARMDTLDGSTEVGDDATPVDVGPAPEVPVVQDVAGPETSGDEAGGGLADLETAANSDDSTPETSDETPVVSDFDAIEDALLVEYDPATSEAPNLEILSDQNGSSLVLDGEVIAAVPDVPDLQPDDVVLVPAA